MTKTLTPAQRTLLAVAAETPDGIETTPATRPTIAALIKAGLLLLPPGEGAPDRLVVTPLGRALVEAGFDQGGAKEGNDADIGETVIAEPVFVKPTKTDLLRGLLRRPDGATIAEMSVATGWLPHSVRGFMAGTLKKKFNLTVASAKEERGRVYRLPAEAETDGDAGAGE